MDNSITFIGHSTLLIDIDDFAILTDPIFSNSVYWIPRVKKIGMSLEETRNKTDLILISHAHKDHLNQKTLKSFSNSIPIATHTNNIKYIKQINKENIFEFKYWESAYFKNDAIKITSVPADHSKTLPWGPIGTCGGFVIESQNHTIYFAGDTSFAKDIFEEIASKFNIDILLMPVGSYSPRWLLKGEHANPDEALKALDLLGAKKMIPIHWGSFMFAFDTPDKPIKVLKKKIIDTKHENRVVILKNGQVYSLY